MSRTYRRKNVKLPRWMACEYIKTRYEDETHSWFVWGWIQMEKKALAQSTAKFYGDHGWTLAACGRGPGKSFRRDEQKKYRAKARQELFKILKDPDYEVQIQANPYLPYWD